jgi:Abnormal spindle-like microcephaly-assoc'd, ASPM-SPD-2-Hydin
MFAFKKFLTTVVFLMFLGAASLFFGGTTAFAFVGYGEFGDVPLGETKVLIVEVIASPTNEITLTALSLEKGDSSEFSIKTTLPEGGVHLLPDESVGIEVTYSPTALGPAGDTLVITTDNPWIKGLIVLTGTGVEAQPPQGVKAILNFFDNAVDTGRLEGKGKGKSAAHRLNALRNMIRSTEKMLKAKGKGKKRACKRLRAISRKIKSHVQGDAVGELSAMVSKLMRDLGCK